ncbi:8952_t:CDS:2 [Gigaspora margarita]|uniref:8952_t:CDS:1 n=1 Tax=Gigaspora margarita TaxID=4874 RepID=A0ABN7V054_GIGMA|nr:8952_t:CDS:2 [Gigaspora margarita]
MTKTDARFVLTTKEAISEFQQASRNVNTDKSKNVSIHEIFLHKTLDGHIKSLVNDSDKNRKQSSPLEIDKIKFILNSPAVAVNNPKGLMRKLKELDDNGMQLELPKEKNHTGGIKDLYAESGNSLIPPNIPEKIYIPVADIQKYLSKHPNNAKDNYFFIGINTPKKVYHSDWYLISKLEKGSYDTMIHSICKDAKLDFKSRCITNHSIQSMDIHNLHQSLKHKRNNVSLLIPIKKAELNSHELNSCEPDSCKSNSCKPDSCIALKDSTSNYINKGFFKASNLFFS